MSPVLNGEMLKTTANANHTASVLSKLLAQRQRANKKINISNLEKVLLRSGEKIVSEDYNRFWKGLQETDVGSIVFGRKGGDDYFIFHYSLKSVGQAMMDGKDFEAIKLSPPNVKTKTHAHKPTKSYSKEVIEQGPSPSGRLVYVALRPDFGVEINLPIDINGAEVGAICSAIKRSL